jgi:hypothetical protein
MQRTFLDKLHINGTLYLIGALLLFVGAPLYQALILLPEGYENALTALSNASFSAYLLWLNSHLIQFLGYRILLILAFAVLISFPFTLFRIIVAQEILGSEEEIQQGETLAKPLQQEPIEDNDTDKAKPTDGMPPYAWRGKGIAVIAAWAGLLSMLFYACGTAASTIYLAIVSSNTTSPANFLIITNILNILPNTVGGGLLALSCLFFGVIIARRGLRLWPRIWVAFGYSALAVAALLSGSAVGVATAPITGQAILTTPATLLFALWILWFGIMLIRLKPEP